MIQTLLATVFLLSGILIIPAGILSAYYWRAFERHMQTNHPSTWAKIAPNPAAEPSASAPNARFITQRQYRTLDDPELNALGDKCFRFGYLAISAFLVLVLSGIASTAFKA